MKQFFSKPINLVLLGIVIVVIAVGILLGVKNMNDQTSLKKANEAAESYIPKITSYKKATDEELKAQSAGVNTEQSAKAFAQNVDTKLKAIPSLESVDSYGAERSESYKNALKLKNSLTASYIDLKKSSEEYATARAFTASIEGMLGMKVSDYLGGGAVMDGTPVRQKLIPPYQAALDAFKKVQVPNGQEELAKSTAKTYTDFISAANDAAAKLDAHQSFSFDFSKEFAALQAQLDGFKSASQAGFTTAVQKTTK